MSYLKTQIDARVSAFESAKAIIDLAQSEDRGLDATEQESVDRATAEMDRLGVVIADTRAMVGEAEIRSAVANHVEARPAADAPKPVAGDAETIRSLARGEIRSAVFEKRDVTKASTGAPVPTSFYDQVILLARATGPMLGLATELNTASGENLQIPRLSTYSVGSVNSEGAAFGESDPAFSAFITLGAFKYGFLTQLSSELIADSGVDIMSLLATNVGNALGFVVNTKLTVGTGTVEPNGIVTAAGSGITGGTGVSGAFTYANLVNLLYSVDSAARALNGFGFMAKGTGIAAMRLLQDGAGNYIFQPSMSESTPDRVLGYALYENPAMAAPATSAKSVIAGHFPSYMARTVGGIRLDRSDDFAFSEDLVTFRCSYRVDGNLPQSSHVKYFIGNAS